MGYVVHRVLVVTTWKKEEALIALAAARRIMSDAIGSQPQGDPPGASLVSPLMVGVVNAYYTFTIGPSGSKTGWGTDERHTAGIEAVAEYLRSRAYDDGSSSFEWFIASYGSDPRRVETEDSQWTVEEDGDGQRLRSNHDDGRVPGADKGPREG